MLRKLPQEGEASPVPAPGCPSSDSRGDTLHMEQPCGWLSCAELCEPTDSQCSPPSTMRTLIYGPQSRVRHSQVTGGVTSTSLKQREQNGVSPRWEQLFHPKREPGGGKSISKAGLSSLLGHPAGINNGWCHPTPASVSPPFPKHKPNSSYRRAAKQRGSTPGKP